MSSQAPASYSEPAVPSEGDIAGFRQVFASELKCIEAHRDFLRWKYPDHQPPAVPEEPPLGRRQPVLEAVGLALSGGGIRSAAFCLGVLQALDATTGKSTAAKKRQRKPTLLERIDYLSTVSGGGYIGSSLSVAMSLRAGRFPFRSRLDQEETASIKHIRDHSNYLFPNGWLDALDSVAIYLRGLLANFLIVLGPLLLLVVFTVFCSPFIDALSTSLRYQQLVTGVFGHIPEPINFGSFGFTKLIFVFGLALFLLWGLASVVERLSRYRFWSYLSIAFGVVRRAAGYLRDRVLQLFNGRRPAITWRQVVSGDGVELKTDRLSETGSRWVRSAGFVLAVLLISAFFEVQPWVLNWLLKAGAAPESVPAGGFDYWVKVLTIVYAALASAVSLFADKLAKLARLSERAGGWLARSGQYSIRAVVYLASAAVPLVIWWIYLELSIWSIADKADCTGTEAERDCFKAPIWLFQFARSTFLGNEPVLSGVTHWFASLGEMASSWLGGMPLLPTILGNIGLQIATVLNLIQLLIKILTDWAIESGTLIAGAYMLAAIVLFVLVLIPTLNANSLHRLYRDRLSVAFIFYEKLPVRVTSWLSSVATLRLTSAVTSGLMSVIQSLTRPARKTPAAQTRSARPAAATAGAGLTPLAHFKLSAISACYGPYHLINAALNIQGSKYANQRARNAEFFTFSRNYTGSEATGYVTTQQMEAIDSNLDLATAMAVSGAAASSNMGSNTIRSLTPTLTLLNIRLGYWLRNPIAAVGLRAKRFFIGLAEMANIFFYLEMFGLLDEKSFNVYLTDGGHIENLGVYELLKRRCKFIIAVDAEADPTMTFASLVKLQRHARIDLGTRIELPWQAIRDLTLETGKKIEEGGAGIPNCDCVGPHAALGVIKYPHGGIGHILYIKASMSGDENDYIIDYKRRNRLFPHESTGDQFFTEEQFEVYRALGFHAAFRVFSGEDRISALAPGARKPRPMRWTSAARTQNPFRDIRVLLRL